MVWTDRELKFIKDEYEKGLTKNEVYLSYIREFGEVRTETSIVMKLKRMKISVNENLIRIKRSNASKGSKNGMFGKTGANKGLTKENSERVKTASIKISFTKKKLYKDGILDTSGDKNGMFGKTAWNLGLTKESDERIDKCSYKLSESAKNRWESYSTDEKNMIIGRMTEANNKKKKDTSIELKIESLLKELNIVFIKQYRKTKWVFDFYLPAKDVYIECQGDYWHANPLFVKNKKLNEIQQKNIERDDRKKIFIKENKLNVIFLWESDINKNISGIETLLKTL